MLFVKRSIVAIIGLLVSLSNCTKRQNSDLPPQVRSLEQQAIDFVSDSLVENKIFRSDDFVVVPPQFHERWKNGALFDGMKVIADPTCDSLSRAYTDYVEFMSSVNEMTDSAKQVRQQLMRFYNHESGEKAQIEYLELPANMSRGSMKEFLTMRSENTVFLRVLGAVKSDQTSIVEVEVHYFRGSSLTGFSFVFLFSEEGAIRWDIL